MQATPLFPGEPYLGDDEPTYKEGDEQARDCRKDDLVGYWAQSIWHWVPPQESY